MQLDSFTIVVATCVALVVLGLTLLYFWYRDRRATWLLWWAIPFLAMGLSITSYLQPAWRMDFTLIAGGNAIRIAAVGLLWIGARSFAGRPVMLWPVLAVVGLWVALCTIPAFLDSLAARVVAVSVANGLFSGLAAWELWRGREQPLPSRCPVIIALGVLTAIMLGRTVLVNYLPFPVGALPLDPLWLAGFNLAVYVLTAFLGLALVALSKERFEFEQRQHALLDPLTGLMNRRALMSYLDRAGRRHHFGADRVTILVLDIDRFKDVNDRHGHETGDRVLAGFAAVAEASVRPSDLVYRMGGEEFCIILPDAGVHVGIEVAERLRRSFEATAVETRRGPAATTVSIGVAADEGGGADLEALLASADAAVYEAKARGRNRVVVAEPLRPAEHDAVTVSFESRARRRA